MVVLYCSVLWLYSHVCLMLRTNVGAVIQFKCFLNMCMTLWMLYSVRWGSFQCISAAVSLLSCSLSNGSVWGSNWVPSSNGLVALLCCTRCSGYEWNETATCTSQHTGSITYAQFIATKSLLCLQCWHVIFSHYTNWLIIVSFYAVMMMDIFEIMSKYNFFYYWVKF